MNLWYVNMWLNPLTGYDDDYRYEFTLYTRFISNYFSRQVRKKENKFETDGSFNMLSVNPMPDRLRECRIVTEAALSIDVPFDKKRYDEIKGTENFEYYIELLKKGFEKASKCKEIPLQMLLQITDDFRKNSFKNEWLHRKKRFIEKDIEVSLICYFTTLDFKLTATIKKVSNKEVLCSEIIIRTEPDEIYFAKMFKDIVLDEKNIIITDESNSPRILINLENALNKKLSFKILGDREIKTILSYAR